MFIFFALFLFFSKTKKQQLLHLGLLLIVSYRGIVTFSRGGVITGLIMILVLFVLTYRYSNNKAKSKIVLLIIGALLLGSLTWSYSVIQTGGLIENRYANQDARGREKEDRLGGREQIAMTELQMFWDNPLLGIGVGKNKEFREEETGIVAASHNEVTRLLAEHGSLGILALLILVFVPLLSAFENKQNLFLLPFYLFWALTINHAAMRLAAPAFIYALTLLKVNFDEEPSLHREQII
jgi:O-antigen ligase